MSCSEQEQAGTKSHSDESVISADNTRKEYTLDLDDTRATYRIDHALMQANQKEKEMQEKINQLLTKLDETNEDELLAIDFRNMRNDFKYLQEEILPHIKFRLPTRWTKKYAYSLMSDKARRDHCKPPDFISPVYSIGSDDNLKKKGFKNSPYLRQTKSLSSFGTPSLNTEPVSNAYDLDSPLKVTKSDTLHEKGIRKINEKLESCESSHNGLLDLSCKDLMASCASEVISDHDDVHISSRRSSEKKQMTFAMLKLDGLLSKAKNCNGVSKDCLPHVADVATTESKIHVSVAIQTDDQIKSVFREYVELKREMEKHVETGQILHELKAKRQKINFLKNVSVAQYMNYKKKNKEALWITYEIPDYKSDAPTAKLEKKANAHDLPVKKVKKDAATIAMAPGHSTNALHDVPSSKIAELRASLKEDKEWYAYQDQKLELHKHEHQQSSLKTVTSSSVVLPVIATASKSSKRSNVDITRKTSYRTSLSQDIFRGPCISQSFSSIPTNASEDALTLNRIMQEAQRIVNKHLAKNLYSPPDSLFHDPNIRKVTSNNGGRLTPKKNCTQLGLNQSKRASRRRSSALSYHHSDIMKASDAYFLKPLETRQKKYFQK